MLPSKIEVNWPIARQVKRYKRATSTGAVLWQLCEAALGQYPEPHWARPTQYTVQSQFTVEFHLSFDNRLTGALTRLGAVLLLLVGNVGRGLGALFCTLRGAN